MSRYLRLTLLAVVVACTPSVGGSFLPVATVVQTAACEGVDGWRCPKLARPTLVKAGNQPIIPASWTVGTWFVDPTNSSATASDGNDCTTSATACRTWQEIAVHRWGTNSPRLRQSTTITFISSQSGNSDPVYLTPFVENGAVVALKGVLGASQQVATGTITLNNAKNRAGGQLLDVTLPAGGAVGQLLVNTDHASRAWIYKNVSGNEWLVSQPLVAVAIPITSTTPAEVDTWTTNDHVTMYTPVAINLAEVGATLVDWDGGFNNILTVYQCNILAPSALANLKIEPGMLYVAESGVSRIVNEVVDTNSLASAFVNDDISAIFHGSGGPAQQLVISGGQLRGSAADCEACVLRNDAIVGSNFNLHGESSYKEVFIDTGKTLDLVYGNAGPFSGAVVWGAGTLDVGGNSRWAYPTGGVATSTFLQTGFQMNEATTACSHSGANSPDVVNCAISLTPAHLDAGQGTAGFGGLAFNPGGASIVANNNN